MDRRTLLRSGGGLVAVGTIAASAGCSDGDSTAGADDGTRGTPEPTLPENWAGTSGTQPTASFSIDYTQGEPIGDTNRDGFIEITHQYGDTIDARALEISGQSVSVRGNGGWEEQFTNRDGTVRTRSSKDDYVVAAGSSVYVDADADYRITVRWVSPTSSASKTLAEDAGPDA